MAKRKIERYTFANAYIGSFVKNLMSHQDMMRLAGSNDLSAAEAILTEYGYEESKELKDGDIESFIKREQENLHSMIYDTLPDCKETALCFFPFDYHNVKVCLKSEFLGITPSEEYLASTGDLDWKNLVAMIRDRSYDFMPVHMKHAIMEATDLFGRGGDPQEIDIIMDKACYKDMIDAANESGEQFLIDMIKFRIDTINLKTFTRLRKIQKPWSFFQKVFVDGGNINQQFFISCYEEPYAQVADKLAPYGLKEVMAEGGRELDETGNFGVLEKLCEKSIMEFNKKAKYLSFGIAPILGYRYAKETEIDNLRIILTGILIGQTPEEISERLREPYV